MDEYGAFLAIMRIAEANGYWWDRGFEPVLVRGSRIIGNTHVRQLLNPALLEAVFGSEPADTGLLDADLNPVSLPAWRWHGHRAYDLWLDRKGGMVDYLRREALKHANRTPESEPKAETS